MKNAGKYSKFIVSALGAVTTALTTEFPSARWVPVVIVALNAAAVYLIPNYQPAA
jgi:hypothetical protein